MNSEDKEQFNYEGMAERVAILARVMSIQQHLLYHFSEDN